MTPVYCGLIHHPVRDRAGATITTSITNLDVHDIARTSRTYGLAGYFVVTPIDAQRVLVGRILEHWRHGEGRQRVPERGEALALVQTVATLEEACAAIATATGRRPRLWATAARAGSSTPVAFAEARQYLADPDPVLLLFGTGHGLAEQLLATVDLQLAPVAGRSQPGAPPYNHLSVRAAAAIVIDRLLGPGP